MPLPRFAFINGEFVPVDGFDALTLTSDEFGGAISSTDSAFASYVTVGTKWGLPTMGTSGEVVTWSFIPQGIAIDGDVAAEIHDAFGVSPSTVTALSGFLAAGIEGVIRAAFAAWEQYADIRFVQVADDGRSVGTGEVADIRIGGISVDGPGNTLAFTYFPGQGAISGEVFLDTGDAGLFYDTSQADPWHALYLTALHEIGHAIGLDHEETSLAIMNPVLNLNLTGLQPNDIGGEQAIYGWRPEEGGDLRYYNMPADETLLTAVYTDLAWMVINGTDGDDRIVADMAQVNRLDLAGGNGNDFLDGRRGAYMLDGGSGADTMFGGNGSTDYVVDNPGDVVIDSGTGVGDGDRVYASISYTIPDTIEAVWLTGSDNINATGDSRRNSLVGNSGDNILDGRGGGDFLAGGDGNDVYYIRDRSDTVVDFASTGIDTIYTPFGASMTSGIENVILLGSENNAVLGNDESNLIVGNAGNDILSGWGGDDTIAGGAGGDQINTGNGRDTVIFSAGDGRDSLYDFTRGSDVIQISIAGYGNFDSVMGVASISGANTLFTFNANDVLTVWGILPSDFTVADITFGGLPPLPSPPPSWSPPSLPPPPPSPPPPSGGTTTIGSGVDALTIKVSEDAWNGDAQYTISVDGVQIGGTLTAHAAHASGQSDILNVLGNWAPGDHTLAVNFINDAWGGTPATDRNLYIDGVSYDDDGTGGPLAVAGGTGTLLSAGGFAVAFHDAGSGTAPPPPPPSPPSGGTTIGSGSDALTVRISEDAWNGDAQYTVSVDGVQIGGTLTAHALHGSGQSDAITVLGDWAAGDHALTVTFLNDAWGGTPDTDRNLYVDGLAYSDDGSGPVAVVGGNGVLMSAGAFSVTFHDGGGTVTPPPPSGGSSTIALHVSEDAWNGDAQFLVFVDGVQQGAARTATASHTAGQVQDVMIIGDFGAQGPQPLPRIPRVSPQPPYMFVARRAQSAGRVTWFAPLICSHRAPRDEAARPPRQRGPVLRWIEQAGRFPVGPRPVSSLEQLITPGRGCDGGDWWGCEHPGDRPPRVRPTAPPGTKEGGHGPPRSPAPALKPRIPSAALSQHAPHQPLSGNGEGFRASILTAAARYSAQFRPSGPL